MELILNINQYGYAAFLDSNVDSLVIGLKDYCTGYLMSYPIEDFTHITNYVHEANKKIYMSINKVSNESTIDELETIMNKIKESEVDGFVISDFGILEMFKEHGLINKVIFNPVTTVTNKYNAKICNDFGINHVCVANELNIQDILQIAKYTNGNIEILAQGYYQICNSKRPLLTLFTKQFADNEYEEGKTYYIQEESRDYAYPIIQTGEDLLIYIDKQRTILPYFDKIKKANINYLRIDTQFIDIDQVNLLINIYRKAIDDDSSITESLKLLKEKTDSNLKCLDNISLVKKEKENE